MPTSPTHAVNPPSAEQIRRAALDRLRQSPNPFAFSVATAGTEDDCLAYDVPDLFDSQRADLHAVVELYRNPKQPSRVYPILGDAGTGKTHLLTTFQASRWSSA